MTEAGTPGSVPDGSIEHAAELAAGITNGTPLSDRLRSTIQADRDYKKEKAAELDEKSIKPGQVDTSGPISSILKASMESEHSSELPAGVSRIHPEDVSLEGDASHLSPGNPKDFSLPEKFSVVEPLRTPESVAKRAAVQIALDQSFPQRVGTRLAQPIDFGTHVVDKRRKKPAPSTDVPFGERIGAGKAQHIDQGVRVADHRVVTADGEVRTPDAPLAPGYSTGSFEKSVSTKHDPSPGEEAAKAARRPSTDSWDDTVNYADS
jgi:hypothetical protein